MADRAEARALLVGAVDTHVHSSPDLVERKLDDYELVRQARERGMAGLVLKNHFFTTALRARLVSMQAPGIAVIGSIVLNQPQGGINPWAVEAAGRGGAKVVWMPTAHSENQLAHESAPGVRAHPAAMHLPGRHAGVRVFDDDGSPTTDTELVLEIIRDRGMVLATGHLTPDEVDRLSARAIEMGLKRIVSTHPDLPAISMPVELQKKLSERGIYFERTFNVTQPQYATLTVPELAARIREVGIGSTIMATDFGQPTSPLPAEGLEMYIAGMLENGISAGEVTRMVGEHARSLLDI
ncbi:MAG: hypothetical protein IT306_05845 [Chloroflexi bacterium]|nr:hypothetical protein [Chloroflexota bacterium]